MKKNTTAANPATAPVITPAPTATINVIAPKPQATAKPKTLTISKTKAAELVLGPAGSKYFNVTFMEKNKSRAKNAPALVERNMTCRRGVNAATKAGIAAAAGEPAPKTRTVNKNLAALGMVTVYQATGEKGYKTLTLPNITALKIGGSLYKVK